MLNLIAQVLVITGAFVWGSIAFFQYDFVAQFATAVKQPVVDKAVKGAVGVAAVVAAFKLFMDLKKPAY